MNQVHRPPPPSAAASSGDPLALTREMVAIPSVNPELEEGGAGEEVLARWCAGLLEEWGFTVSVSRAGEERTSVVGRLGGGGPRLLLNGHLDTVGVTGMSIPPFEPREEDGRLYGRGSCDMKAGVAAILSVAREVGRAPPPQGELVVALTADEEHGSVGLLSLLDQGLTADAAVVCEPTSLAVAPANKGFVWYHLLFRGRAAHGSRPELGVDAIRGAGRFLTYLDQVEAELSARGAHLLLGHPSLHAGTIQGGTAPSVYPEECRLVVERRTLPDEDLDEVRAQMEDQVERLHSAQGSAEGVRATLKEGLTRPGAQIPGDHPLVSGLQDAVEAEGREPRVEGMSAWVESSFLVQAGIPAVCFGPGSILQAHTADEWVLVEEVEAAARILRRFTESFLEGTVSSGPPAPTREEPKELGPRHDP